MFSTLVIVGLLSILPLQILAERQQRWRMLDPIEQLLRRASQGLGLSILCIAVAFWIYGASGFGMLLVNMISYPGSSWMGFIIVFLFVCGLVRGVSGVRRLAGMRDGMRWFGGLVRCGLGIGFCIYIWNSSWWAEVGDSLLAASALMLMLWVGGWTAIVGAIRLVVLSLPQGKAYAVVGQHIKETEFTWKDDEK